MQEPVIGPRPLTEEEIAEKLRNHEAEEQRSRELAAEQSRGRLAALRGIPLGPPFEGLEPVPWKGGLLYGATGTGKSHVAICRLRSTPRPAFVTAYEYLDLARDRENDRLDQFQEDRLRQIVGASHMVIDDIGLHRDTAFALEMLDRLMDDRWKSQAPVLATSNLSPTELRKRLPRFLSRLLSFGPAEKMSGRDRRLEP